MTFHGVRVSWFLCSAGGYWDPPTPTVPLRLRVHRVRDSAKCEFDSFVISLLSPFASTLPAAGNFRCKQKSRSRRSDDGTGSKDIRYVRYGLGVQRSSGERPTLLAWPRRDPMMLAIWPTSGEKYVGKPRKSSEWRVTVRCSVERPAWLLGLLGTPRRCLEVLLGSPRRVWWCVGLLPSVACGNRTAL